MDPIITPALVSAALKAVYGGVQYFQGRKEAKDMVRPNMNVPQGLVDAIRMQTARAGAGIAPGQERAEDRIDKLIANMSSKALASSSPAEAMQLITSITNMGLDSEADLSAEAARYMNAENDKLIGLKKNLAEVQNRMFEVNNLEPYLEAMRAASAKMGAGTQNVFRSMDSAIQTGMASQYQDEVLAQIADINFELDGGSRGLSPISEIGYKSASVLPEKRTIPTVGLGETPKSYLPDLSNFSQMEVGAGQRSYSIPFLRDFAKISSYMNAYN